MQFSKTDSTARQPHAREALALAPASDPVKAYQPWEVSDLSPYRDCFDVSDLPDDLEGHCISVVAGVTVTMDGGEWLAGAGEFSDYRKIPREVFKAALEKMRPKKRR
jgi:hypothetical protein